MKTKLMVGILLFIFNLYNTLNGQYSLQRKYSIEDGLSQNVVFAIHQDREGFLWLATEDGLNRFDGYDFKKYRMNSDEAHSISNNKVLSIFEDSKGMLWIGTKYGGLNRFDKKTERFKKYIHTPQDSEGISSNQYISCMAEEENEVLWIGTDNGLNCFDRVTEEFINYSSINEEFLKNSVMFIWCLKFDQEGLLWIGSSRGLYRLNTINGNVETFLPDENEENSISHEIVRALWLDGDSILWVGTNYGLNRMNIKTGENEKFFESSEGGGLSSNSIRALYRDHFGRLWIGTIKGLNWYNDETGKINHFHYKRSLKHDFSNLFVYDIFQDNRENIWLGTIGEGVLKLRRDKDRFDFVEYSPKDSTGLSDIDLLSVIQSKDGIVWVGTYRGGLNEYHPSTKEFKYYQRERDDPDALNANGVSALLEDEGGDLWLGTFGGGLNCFRRKENRFEHYTTMRPDSLGKMISNQVYSLYMDEDSCLWVGVAGGINCLDLKTGKIFGYSYDIVDNIWSSQVVTSIAKGDSGYLWTGTNGGGLIKLNKKTGVRRRYAKYGDINSISNNRIKALYRDKEGIIWIGTLGGGLNRFDPKGMSFTGYTTDDGLANNDVFSVMEDSVYLWLSTNKGISRFNRDEGTFRNYDLSDGLETYHIDGNSFKTEEGDLIFCGKNGIYFLNPDSLTDNPHVPPMAITKFKIFDREFRLDSNINYCSGFELPYHKNFFSLEFSALDFTDPGKNKYAYQLQGFDDGWIYCGSRRYVSYTNLAGGDYVFRVKGTNNDGLWNEEGKSIRITIHPPFWEEWWFRFLIVMLIGVFVYFFIQFRLKQVYAIESLKNQISADLHDNVGSSLTEISIMSEITKSLIDVDNKQLKNNLVKISEISRYLVSSMSDTVWLINPNKDTLFELILRLKDTYVELLAHYNMKLKTENLSALSRIQLPMSYRQNLYLIFKEAINNSIKYSKCSEIELKAMVRSGNLSMTLKDDGVGFDTTIKCSGNGLLNMKQRAKNINGLLKIYSEEGKGTIIRFMGKIKKSEGEKWLKLK